MEILKGKKRVFAISGLIFLVLGVLMCIWPVGVTGVMCVLAGIALLASGGWKVWGYFKKKKYALPERLDFAAAALQAMLGLVMIVKTKEISVLVPPILGVMVLVNCVFQIQTALELKAKNSKGWWYYLAAASVCALIALVMMFDPFGNYRLVSIFMGIAFIADGLTDIWTALYLKGWLERTKLM